MIKQLFFRLWDKRLQACGYMFGMMAVFLGLAISSYQVVDPSFNHATDNEVENWMGMSGAYVSDLFIQFFGFGSAVLVVALAVWAWRVVWVKHLSFVPFRCVLGIVSVSLVAGIAAMFQVSEHWPFYVGYGGLVGDLLKAGAEPYLTIYGYAIVTPILAMATLYFALAVQVKEVYAVCRAVKILALKIHEKIVRLGVIMGNAYRKLRKREPIEKPKEEIVKKPQNIVEFKPTQTKTVARQKTMKLSPDDEIIPDLDLLVSGTNKKKNNLTQSALEQNAKLLKRVLEDFGVIGDIIKVRPGPVDTLYELEPSPGTKSSRVIGLADDIARSMSAVSARIAVVPGRNVLGIELPNADREVVYLRELLETDDFRDTRIKLPIALGMDIGGSPVMTDLSRMPHLLVAGTTGSGKSVAVNAMILSLIYRLTPDECKFIMIDPKMLELSVYDGIPHLLSPVVTEPGKAVVALKWAVKEMEQRYRLMSNLGVRNVTGYNKRIEEAIKKDEKLERTVQTGFDPESGEPIYERVPLEMNKLPYLVILVDEMADLMLTAGKDVESSIQRLAQMARAAGIHLVMATQRPSVDVITGIIKANFPTRISFQVTSRIDSRTILGEMGAEQLLGMGDMLYMAGGGRITRVHGPFVDDKEVIKVVKELKQYGKPNYIEEVTKEDNTEDPQVENSGDELYDKAVSIVLRDKKASTSYIQRQLKIGYNRAANIIEKMEQEGVISAANHAGKREILVA